MLLLLLLHHGCLFCGCPQQILLLMQILPKTSWLDSSTRPSSSLKPGWDTTLLTWRSASKSPQTSTELYSGHRYAQTRIWSIAFISDVRYIIRSVHKQFFDVNNEPKQTRCNIVQQALVLCHFLDINRDKYNLTDKNVIELGAGTGLVTIVSSLLGTESWFLP